MKNVNEKAKSYGLPTTVPTSTRFGEAQLVSRPPTKSRTERYADVTVERSIKESYS